jgi:hypothetical protein
VNPEDYADIENDAAWLEETQAIPNFSAFGVYRRTDGDWRPAPELSEGIK